MTGGEQWSRRLHFIFLLKWWREKSRWNTVHAPLTEFSFMTDLWLSSRLGVESRKFSLYISALEWPVNGLEVGGPFSLGLVSRGTAVIPVFRTYRCPLYGSAGDLSGAASYLKCVGVTRESSASAAISVTFSQRSSRDHSSVRAVTLIELYTPGNFIMRRSGMTSSWTMCMIWTRNRKITQV